MCFRLRTHIYVYTCIQFMSNGRATIIYIHSQRHTCHRAYVTTGIQFMILCVMGKRPSYTYADSSYTYTVRGTHVIERMSQQVEGLRHRVYEPCLTKVLDIWTDCIKVPVPRRTPGMKTVEIKCFGMHVCMYIYGQTVSRFLYLGERLE